MNILVTGANGQLGSEIRILSEKSRHRYIFTDVNDVPGAETVRLDITDPDAVAAMVSELEIGVIINCAAYTNVEKAEEDREAADRLNHLAVANLAGAAKAEDCVLIHISTDYVFGREPYNVPCREDQKGTPTGVYGETKLLGEQAVMASGCRYMIIRTAWLYSEFGKNFLKTMLDLTSSKPEIKVVFDQTGTPTYALDLAETICGIVEDGKYEGKYGIYHYSDEGVCSWYDFARMIAEYAGNTGCRVLPCHSCEFPSKVVRPSYSVLDKTKIKTVFGICIPHWTESLRRCMGNLVPGGAGHSVDPSKAGHPVIWSGAEGGVERSDERHGHDNGQISRLRSR